MCTEQMGTRNRTGRFSPIEFHLSVMPAPSGISYAHLDISNVPSPHLSLFCIIAVMRGHFSLLFWLMPFLQPFPKVWKHQFARQLCLLTCCPRNIQIPSLPGQAWPHLPDTLHLARAVRSSETHPLYPSSKTALSCPQGLVMLPVAVQGPRSSLSVVYPGRASVDFWSQKHLDASKQPLVQGNKRAISPNQKISLDLSPQQRPAQLWSPSEVQFHHSILYRCHFMCY